MDARSPLACIEDPGSGACAGVLAGAGGRLVLLRAAAGDNLLLACPERWDLTHHPAPRPSASTRFTPYQGHIHWLAPQRDWWLDQDLDPGHPLGWPPDPWLTVGAYAITHHDDHHLSLVGPVSPLSGLRLHKTYAWCDGELHITCRAENAGARPRAWALWSNARFAPARARPWIPLASTAPGQPAGASVDEGWWSLPAAARHAPAAGGKWFLDCSAHRFAVAVEEQALLIARAPITAAEVAPGQAPVEIYCAPATAAEPGLLEVEHHGPLRTLAPGEATTLHERWRLVAAPAATQDAGHRRIADLLAAVPGHDRSHP